MTSERANNNSPLRISIHAPTGGATNRHSTSSAFSREFQSTLPRGERLFFWNGRHDIMIISIHAPTGGATGILFQVISDSNNFNPRSHGGSDYLITFWCFIHHSFNPRSHGGATWGFQMALVVWYLFQSTLPRGERHATEENLSSGIKFQSTLPRGERLGHDRIGGRMAVSFNPRSHGGSDSNFPPVFVVAIIVSIHAPTGGATLPFLL